MRNMGRGRHPVRRIIVGRAVLIAAMLSGSAFAAADSRLSRNRPVLDKPTIEFRVGVGIDRTES